MSSDVTGTEMEYELYFKSGRNYSYIVHFVNRLGLEQDKIRALFSQFGTVTTVEYGRNDVFGLCFVGFTSVAAVQFCVDSFWNSKHFKILKHKSKFNNSPQNDAKEFGDKTGERTKNQKRKTVRLSEIIVSQIPSDVELNSLLDLFEGHSPICITPIKTSPRLNVKYCHVYFQNETKAQLAVQQFNGYKLHDSTLAVYTLESLLLQASCN